MGKYKNRIGEENTNNQGLKMKIIKYKNCDDIDVAFEDGYIVKNRTYQQFKKGNIKNIFYKSSNIIDRTGEINYNNQGLKMEIINYNNYDNIDIKFEDGTIIKNKTYDCFKKGNIKNPNLREIFNIGYFGTGKYNADDNIERYSRWRNMIKRCYDKTEWEKRPTYKECSVCDEWHNFQNFAEWHDKNYYKINNEEMHLDKDILVKGNKIYSPETCIFVPEKINCLFVKSNKIRGELPIGVTKHYKKYIAQCKIKGIHKYIGLFDTEEEAFMAYKEFKENYIKQIADEYKYKIPEKLYNALYSYEVEFDD